MAGEPTQEFGKRRPVTAPRPGPPVKRSGHVALLLMGTLAVGGGAYALMPGENCQRASPGMAAPATSAECPPHGSSSGSHGSSGGGSASRSNFFSGDFSSGSSSSATSDSGSGHVARGGFGSFAHAFGFSGG